MLRMARLGLFAFVFLALGCDGDPLQDWLDSTKVVPTAPATHETPPREFDASATGVVSGRVVWQGEHPVVPEFRYSRFQIGKGLIWGQHPNPNSPRIGEDGGVGDVVISLVGDGLTRARPWDHGPLRVELIDHQIRLTQGDAAPSQVGFARPGDSMEIVAREAASHSLRADGAAFISVKVPTPDRPITRQLPEKGFVELSSDSQYFWARGYVFVSDNPYVTRTSADGRFEITGVPPGDYRVTCWAPNWNVAEQIRDPETVAIARQLYADPLTLERSVRVGENSSEKVEFTLAAEQFPRKD